jgi:hypothetical protein
VDTCERFIPGANIRKDLFGVFDLVAIHPAATGVLGVQVTSRANAASRREKMRASKLMALWLECGNHAELHHWKLEGERGKRKWQIKIEPWLGLNRMR